MAKKMKFNSKGIVTTVLVGAGTGVGVQVIEGLVGMDDKTTGMGLVVIGAVLPEVMKQPVVSEIGKSALAIGAYKLASAYDVASMLGITATTATTTTTTTASTSGVGAAVWMPKKGGKVNKVSGAAGGAKSVLL